MSNHAWLLFALVLLPSAFACDSTSNFEFKEIINTNSKACDITKKIYRSSLSCGVCEVIDLPEEVITPVWGLMSLEESLIYAETYAREVKRSHLDETQIESAFETKLASLITAIKNNSVRFAKSNFDVNNDNVVELVYQRFNSLYSPNKSVDLMSSSPAYIIPIVGNTDENPIYRFKYVSARTISSSFPFILDGKTYWFSVHIDSEKMPMHIYLNQLQNSTSDAGYTAFSFNPVCEMLDITKKAEDG